MEEEKKEEEKKEEQQTPPPLGIHVVEEIGFGDEGGRKNGQENKA